MGKPPAAGRILSPAECRRDASANLGDLWVAFLLKGLEEDLAEVLVSPVGLHHAQPAEELELV
jgi:hypothetical protein